MSQIERISTQLFAVPLPEVLTDAKHGDHTHFQLITVTIGSIEFRSTCRKYILW